MLVEKNVPLQFSNTFGIVAKALSLVRIRSESDVQAVLTDPALRDAPKFVLGGGSNIVLTGDVKPLVLKMELAGKRLQAVRLRDGRITEYHEVANTAPAFVDLNFAPERIAKIVGKQGTALRARPEMKRHLA